MPYITVRWYDGGIYCSGECAVYPGETPEQAADRGFGARYVEGGPLRGRVGSTVSITECPLF